MTENITVEKTEPNVTGHAKQRMLNLWLTSAISCMIAAATVFFITGFLSCPIMGIPMGTGWMLNPKSLVSSAMNAVCAAAICIVLITRFCPEAFGSKARNTARAALLPVILITICVVAVLMLS